MNSKKLQPIIKWVGGKRQLLPEISRLVPKKFNNYIEPFIGGAAVLLELMPKQALINDLNESLIKTYKCVKDKPEELIELLKEHKKLNSKEYFYLVRSQDRDPNYKEWNDLLKASRLIYLNKTCFNGLFRVNQAGFFNTPYGAYKNPNIVNEEAIRNLSNYFNKNKIIFMSGDYKEVLKKAKKDDFVYLDPPYMPVSSSASFTGYTENGFSKEQQVELKKECDKLNKKGVKFLLSNSEHEFIKELYKDYKITIVTAKRTINSDAAKRGNVNEVLVRNYD
ncbi:DNA adenine methylase [Mycoplasma sp. 4044]